MKLVAAALLAAIMTPSAGSSAQSSARSPLVGDWSVDVARMPNPPAERPRSVTTAFRDAGGGKWAMEVAIDYGNGAPIRATSTFALDGVPVPATGTPEADTIAAKRPAPNVLVVSLGKGGQQASTRVYAVQPDGRTMIETAVYYRDGAPVLRTNYFNRIPAK